MEDYLFFIGVIGVIAFYYKMLSLKRSIDQKTSELIEEERKIEQETYKLADEKWKLEQERLIKQQEYQKQAEYLKTLRNEFDASYIQGRKWLAKHIAEADRAFDESISLTFRTKKRPAMKAADEITAARTEKRKLKEQLKFLEYQIESYKEYFPFLEEYEEFILNEAIQYTPNGIDVGNIETADPVLFYVPKIEYERLSSLERNQLALERYLNKSHSRSEIGRIYERYLGYLYEQDGWTVEYFGIVEGYEDLGRDLICRKGNQVKIIQAKCWSSEKQVHEKHIFQLFGTTQLYIINNHKNDLFDIEVFGVFVTTTALSSVAREAAKWLKIDVMENYPLNKKYPMIKCNINQSSKEKIYHLPFDQQYDKTKIIPEQGEFYASTVEEAEINGFRRALRYSKMH